MRITVITRGRLTSVLVAGVFIISAAGFFIKGAAILSAFRDSAEAFSAPEEPFHAADSDKQEQPSVIVSAPSEEKGEAPGSNEYAVQFVLNPDPVSGQITGAQVEIIEENEHDPGKAAGEHIKIEIAGIEKKQPEKKDKPRVLIYHTHTYEAYEQDPKELYVEAYSTKWRSMNYEYNIVKVGEELAKLLRGYGFEVVHDTTAFEPPKLGTAYVRSLEMLKERVKSGEEYDLIIDMHRDSYTQKSWSPKSVVINGESAARLMFLIGTGEDGFTEKPNWKENYALADSLAKAMQAMHPDLCKDINVKTQRYNQHVSEKCVLIEVGHCENTLKEALASMKYFAKAINQTLSK